MLLSCVPSQCYIMPLIIHRCCCPVCPASATSCLSLSTDTAVLCAQPVLHHASRYPQILLSCVPSQCYIMPLIIHRYCCPVCPASATSCLSLSTDTAVLCAQPVLHHASHYPQILLSCVPSQCYIMPLIIHRYCCPVCPASATSCLSLSTDTAVLCAQPVLHHASHYPQILLSCVPSQCYIMPLIIHRYCCPVCPASATSCLSLSTDTAVLCAQPVLHHASHYPQILLSCVPSQCYIMPLIIHRYCCPVCPASATKCHLLPAGDAVLALASISYIAVRMQPVVLYSKHSIAMVLYSSSYVAVLYSNYCMLICSQWSYIATTVCSYVAVVLYSNYCMLICSQWSYIATVCSYATVCYICSASGLI